MSREPVLAVLYAAKSTVDPRGSIPTQLRECRALAEAEGREVVDDFSDETASAYRGNRGPGLTAAKELAARLAGVYGTCELWVQHSDRLARGDGLTADHLAEVFFAMRRAGVRLRSVQDDSNLEDAIRAVLIGERNNEDSRRKSEATRAGRRRQAERGRTRGPIADGYRLETSVVDGVVTTRRVPDPERTQLVLRAFDLAEAGHTFGAIARLMG